MPEWWVDVHTQTRHRVLAETSDDARRGYNEGNKTSELTQVSVEPIERAQTRPAFAQRFVEKEA